jgi:hypothetical protein
MHHILQFDIPLFLIVQGSGLTKLFLKRPLILRFTPSYGNCSSLNMRAISGWFVWEHQLLSTIQSVPEVETCNCAKISPAKVVSSVNRSVSKPKHQGLQQNAGHQSCIFLVILFD